MYIYIFIYYYYIYTYIMHIDRDIFQSCWPPSADPPLASPCGVAMWAWVSLCLWHNFLTLGNVLVCTVRLTILHRPCNKSLCQNRTQFEGAGNWSLPLGGGDGRSTGNCYFIYIYIYTYCMYLFIYLRISVVLDMLWVHTRFCCHCGLSTHYRSSAPPRSAESQVTLSEMVDKSLDDLISEDKRGG